MKNFLKKYALVICTLSTVILAACEDPPANPAPSPTPAPIQGETKGGIIGTWRITAITYRTLDQSYAFGDWLVIFKEAEVWGGLVTKRDFDSVDELYGRYSFDPKNPKTIYLDLSGLLVGFQTPRVWDVVRGNPDTDDVFAVHGTQYIAENPFETSITLKRVPVGSATTTP